MAKIKSFEKYYDEYEKWFEKNNLIFDAELKIAKSLINLEKNGLEVGVGTGVFAEKLGITTGIEPSKEMQKIAQKKGLNIILGIGEKLPFKNESFNFIFINTTICFFDNPQKALQEAYRVIKPKGFIIIGFIDKNSMLGEKYQIKKDKSKFYSEATFFSQEEVNKIVAKVGFVKPISKVVQNTYNSFIFIKSFKENL